MNDSGNSTHIAPLASSAAFVGSSVRLAESTLVEDDGNRTSLIGIEVLAVVMVDSFTVVLVEVVVESVTSPADTSPLLNSTGSVIETSVGGFYLDFLPFGMSNGF